MANRSRVEIPQDVSDFLAGNHRTFLLTLRKDGSPTGHPMAAFYGGGLYFNMYRKSVKARNLERDDSACCVVTTPSDAPDLRGVLLRGRARPVPYDEGVGGPVPPGLALARAPGSAAGQHQRQEMKPVTSATAERVKAGTRVVFEIVPEEVGFLESARQE